MDFQYLKDKIYKDTQPKRINGKKMNGSTLSRFIVEIVNSINSNAIPNINNSWDKVVKDDIVSYKNKALNFFKESIKKYNESNKIKGDNNNLNEKEFLLKFLLDKKLESNIKYNKILLVNSDIQINKSYKDFFKENEEILNTEIDKVMKKLINENDEKSLNLNGRIIRENYRDVLINTINLI
jgi:hypothetical protein